MKKIIFLLIILLTELDAKAQMYFEWSFYYTFTVDNKVRHHFKMDSLNVYVSCPFNSSEFRNGSLFKNDTTGLYDVQLNYGSMRPPGIETFRFPPALFIQVFMRSLEYGGNKPFSLLIPISFDEIEKPEYNLSQSTYFFGSIDLTKFLTGDDDKRLVGIHVNADASIHFYKRSEREFLRPNKLIKL